MKKPDGCIVVDCSKKPKKGEKPPKGCKCDTKFKIDDKIPEACKVDCTKELEAGEWPPNPKCYCDHEKAKLADGDLTKPISSLDKRLPKGCIPNC